MRKTKAVSLILALVASTVALAGCGKGEAPKTPDGGTTVAKKDEPVTLNIFAEVGVTEDDFKKLFADPVKKKYPYITLTLMTEKTSSKLENLIFTGQTPDMLLITNNALAKHKDAKLTYDITPAAKAINLDLTKFESVYLDSLRAISEKNELMGLPYGVQFTGLFYNKDLFDRFGAAYPKDGMTWDETIELAKRLTKTDNGTQFRGLDMESVGRLGRQKGLTPYNYKTGQIEFQTDGWKQIFETTQKANSIPGNASPNVLQNPGYNQFLKDKTLAMFATYSLLDVMKDAEKTGLNWDVAQYPSFPDSPNISRDVDVHMMVPVTTSKHKDALMRVMEVVVSEEVQMISAKQTARLTPLNNDAIKKALGEDLPFLKGKKIDSMLKGKARLAPVYTEYHSQLTPIVRESFKGFIDGKDLNTALREGEEKMKLKVAEMKAK